MSPAVHRLTILEQRFEALRRWVGDNEGRMVRLENAVHQLNGTMTFGGGGDVGVQTGIAVTDESGIDAATWDGTDLAPGSATCTFLDDVTGGWELGATTDTVYNVMPAAVAADTLIQVKKIDGRWVVDVEACP
jgi:hypothetical protein